MKKLLNVFTLTALLATIGIMSVSCEPESPKLKELDVTIALGTTTATSISVTIMSQKDVTGYNYAIGKASDLAAFLDGSFADIKKQDDPSVMDIVFDNLEGGVEYTVFAQGFAGTEKGQVATRVITTPKDPSQYDLAVEFELEPTRTEIMVRFTKMGKDAEEYEYAIGTPADLAAFENGTLKNTQTVKASVKSVIINGLQEKKEYTVFARAISGEVKGATVANNTRTFKMVLDVVVKNVTSTTATIEFTPSEDTARYKYALGTIGILPLFESGVYPDIKWENDVTKVLVTNASGLNPGEEYCIFSQPYSSNNTKSETTITKFKTPTADPE